MTEPDLSAYEIHKYRKTATVFARKVNEGEQVTVYSLEGLAQASPGDYICTGIDGEEWVVAGDIFERTYERIDE